MPGPYPATIFFDLGDTLVTTVGGVRQRYADTLDCLQILKARGYRLGLLSNQAAGTTVAAVQAQLDQLHLGRYIEPGLITLSTEIPGNVGIGAQHSGRQLVKRKALRFAILELIVVLGVEPAEIMDVSGCVLRQSDGFAQCSQCL